MKSSAWQRREVHPPTPVHNGAGEYAGDAIMMMMSEERRKAEARRRGERHPVSRQNFPGTAGITTANNSHAVQRAFAAH